MSEDEGTNGQAQGVPSETEPDDGTAVDVDSDGTNESGSNGADDATSSSESDTSESGTDADPTTDTDHAAADDTATSTEAAGETATDIDTESSTTVDVPKADADLETVVDRVSEYDDDLATQVGSIVDQAREFADTVDHQRAELEDLSERVEAQAETIGDLQDDLESAEAEAEDLESRLKRKQADFQNYKKRAKKRQQQIKDRATEDLVERLLDVRDNLKRALEEDSGDAEGLRDGVEMTLREFDRVLEDENVTEIDPEPGTETDPQRHEVMMRIDSDQPAGTIANVYTPGYEMGEKVIQSAQVTVSNGELADDEGPDDVDEADDTDDADESDGEDSPDDETIELGGEIDAADAETHSSEAEETTTDSSSES